MTAISIYSHSTATAETYLFRIRHFHWIFIYIFCVSFKEKQLRPRFQCEPNSVISSANNLYFLDFIYVSLRACLYRKQVLLNFNQIAWYYPIWSDDSFALYRELSSEIREARE